VFGDDYKFMTIMTIVSLIIFTRLFVEEAGRKYEYFLAGVFFDL
jgi:hypothetical protein